MLEGAENQLTYIDRTVGDKKTNYLIYADAILITCVIGLGPSSWTDIVALSSSSATYHNSRIKIRLFASYDSENI